MNRRKRGRPSAGDLATLTVHRRQPLPPELRGEEAEEFLRIVNAEPADWFSTAAVPLLVQYCRHVVVARRLAELIERVTGRPERELAEYVELIRQQRAESEAIARLATKLRLAPQSVRNERGNLRPMPAQIVPKPWD